MFIFNKGDNLDGIMCIHVDDIFLGSTKQFGECVISKLENYFLIGATDSGQFKYGGISFDKESNMKSLHQVKSEEEPKKGNALT